MFMWWSKKRNSAIPYRSLLLSFENAVCRCDIRTLSTKRYQMNWQNYLDKYGEAAVWGQYEAPVLAANRAAQELIATARDTGVQEALTEYIEGGGGLQHVSSVRRGLEIMIAPSDPPVRFVPPRLNIRLWPWQERLWAQLNETPEVRQIFWVSGPPKSCKTTFTRYLEQEYQGEIINMGECVEMARALLAYRGHALVIFEFPPSFEWHVHRHRVGTFLETFSEFGSYRRSTMYSGARVQLANHLLVFANEPPIENISHRRVLHTALEEILTDTEDTVAEPAVAPGQGEASSQASTLVMEPVFDPMSGEVRNLASRRSEARSRSR